MIIEAMHEMSDAQEITSATNTHSTNIMDLQGLRVVDSSNNSLLPAHQVVEVEVSVGTTFAGGTSLTASVYTHSATTSMQSGTRLATSGAVALASLLKGKILVRCFLPRTGLARYLGIVYDTVGTHTAGAVSANLLVCTPDINN